MTTIDDIVFDNISIKKTADDIFREIKDLVSYTLSIAKKYLAGATLVTTLMALSQDNIPNGIIINDVLPAIEITMPVTAKVASINIAKENDSRRRLFNELKMMSLLEDGWDNEAARKPTRLAIQNAFLLLSGLNDSILPKCTFFPSNDAGIYFQGQLLNGFLSVFLNDVKMSYVVKGKHGKISAFVNVNRESIEYLNIGLKEYV